MTTTAINRSLAASYTISELCEIGSAAAFVLSLAFPKGKLAGALIGALLFLGSVVMQIYAHWVESRAAAQLERERKAGQYVVTAHRLKTLEALHVEADIIEVLALRLDQPALPADDFISWLEEELGTVRAQERLEIILRYTRENPLSASSLRIERLVVRPPLADELDLAPAAHSAQGGRDALAGHSATPPHDPATDRSGSAAAKART